MAGIRAALIGSDGRLGVGERPLPEPGPGEVRVRVLACGICGSDLHFLHTGMYPAGHTPGHEICGVVDAVGTGAATPTGTRVVVEPTRSCGVCEHCVAGDRQICRQFQLLGVHEPGGLAEAVIAPDARIHPVDEGLDPRLCALAEPVAVSVHGLRKAGVGSGQRVLVLGAGALGLTTTLAARALGATVWQSARHAHQAEQATRMGAARVLAEDQATPDRIGESVAGEEPDTVIETVGGTADTLVAAARAVRPGGRIAVLGVFLASPALDPFSMLLKETTLIWSNCYGGDAAEGDFARAVRILSDEEERVSSLLTHARGLDQVAEAFSIADDKKSGAVKVTVTPAG